jgi:transcriptional regulator with XRE-family HTH domain
VSIRSDDLDGLTTGQRIQILRERRGLTRPVLAGLVGMSASWLKSIERGILQPPRLPMLVELGSVLGIGDVAELAGTDMSIGVASVPIARGELAEAIRELSGRLEALTEALGAAGYPVPGASGRRPHLYLVRPPDEAG